MEEWREAMMERCEKVDSWFGSIVLIWRKGGQFRVRVDDCEGLEFISGDTVVLAAARQVNAQGLSLFQHGSLVLAWILSKISCVRRRKVTLGCSF